MKSCLLLSLGLLLTSSTICSATIKSKVFTKPNGLDTQDLCARMPDGVLIADSTDCRLFYYCLNSEAEPVRCRHGYYFDQETSYCLRGDCPAANPITHCDTQQELFTRVDGKCSSFNVCHNGMLLKLECPIGTYYDDNQKTCTVIDNNVHHQCACIMPEYTALPNDRNCHSYFVCTEGKAQPQLCERGLFYNEHLSSCVPDVRGVCTVSTTSKDQKPQLHVKEPQKLQTVIDLMKPLFVEKNTKPNIASEHKEKITKPEMASEHKAEHKDEAKHDHKNEHKIEHKDNHDDNKHTDSHKDNHFENYNKHIETKPKEIVSESEKQHFLNEIRDQLIEKKHQQLIDAHQSHKDKVEKFEKCVLLEEKVKAQEHHKHEIPKPIKKESVPESKPANKLQKPTSSGVYHKLNSKFMIN